MKPSPERVYLDVWLRRMRKELAISGRKRELSIILGEGNSAEEGKWEQRLQQLLSGEKEPDLQLITLLDSALGRNRVKNDQKTADQVDFDF